MIRFAVKVLVVMVAAGYVVRQAEPPAAYSHEPRAIHSAYIPGTDDPTPAQVARDLSSFTNAQIVLSQATRDLAGFCERQALACEAGQELLRRAAAGIRDASARIAGGDTEADEAPLSGGSWHAGHDLPAAPPPRYVTF